MENINEDRIAAPEMIQAQFRRFERWVIALLGCMAMYIAFSLLVFTCVSPNRWYETRMLHVLANGQGLISVLGILSGCIALLESRKLDRVTAQAGPQLGQPAA
jgi:hypothetical protein